MEKLGQNGRAEANVESNTENIFEGASWANPGEFPDFAGDKKPDEEASLFKLRFEGLVKNRYGGDLLENEDLFKGGGNLMASVDAYEEILHDISQEKTLENIGIGKPEIDTNSPEVRDAAIRKMIEYSGLKPNNILHIIKNTKWYEEDIVRNFDYLVENGVSPKLIFDDMYAIENKVAADAKKHKDVADFQGYNPYEFDRERGLWSEKMETGYAAYKIGTQGKPLETAKKQFENFSKRELKDLFDSELSDLGDTRLAVDSFFDNIEMGDLPESILNKGDELMSRKYGKELSSESPEISKRKEKEIRQILLDKGVETIIDQLPEDSLDSAAGKILHRNADLFINHIDDFANKGVNVMKYLRNLNLHDLRLYGPKIAKTQSVGAAKYRELLDVKYEE